jgi:hypothetical protein
MTLIIPFGSACARERENNQANNTDLTVCYVLYTLIVWLPDFITSSLALFNICVEILVTYQRISLISRPARSEREDTPWVACSLIMVVSLAAYTPALFMKEVYNVETRNKTTGGVKIDYFSKKTEFGKSSTALLIEESLTLVRMVLVICVLTIVNIVAFVKFTAFYKQKSALKEIIKGILILLEV